MLFSEILKSKLLYDIKLADNPFDLFSFVFNDFIIDYISKQTNRYYLQTSKNMLFIQHGVK